MKLPSLFTLPPFDPESKKLNVIIETPKGSRNKYALNVKKGGFELKKVLPAGAVFPFDFGFIPSTKGEDGDPLDVLVLMDEPAFCGCLVRARLIGGIKARQKKKHRSERNDRLIAVAAPEKSQSDVHSLRDLNPEIMKEIEHFFVSYNALAGKEFLPLGRLKPKAASDLVKEHTE